MDFAEAYIAMQRSHQELAEICRQTLGILREDQYDGHRRHGQMIRQALHRYETLARAAVKPLQREGDGPT